jgi:hypothetical protein
MRTMEPIEMRVIERVKRAKHVEDFDGYKLLVLLKV